MSTQGTRIFLNSRQKHWKKTSCLVKLPYEPFYKKIREFFNVENDYLQVWIDFSRVNSKFYFWNYILISLFTILTIGFRRKFQSSTFLKTSVFWKGCLPNFLDFTVEICRSMGRLASGIPQIPAKSLNIRPLPVASLDPVTMALRGPQPVVLLKCGADPRSRLLYVSQLLLNDAADRGQKIKVISTLRSGISPKEMACIVSLDRNEKVRFWYFSWKACWIMFYISVTSYISRVNSKFERFAKLCVS